MISSKTVLIVTLALAAVVSAGPGHRSSSRTKGSGSNKGSGSRKGSGIGGALAKGALEGVTDSLQSYNEDSRAQFQQQSYGYPPSQPGQFRRDIEEELYFRDDPPADSTPPPAPPAPAPKKPKKPRHKRKKHPKVDTTTPAAVGTTDQGSQDTTTSQSQPDPPTKQGQMRRRSPKGGIKGAAIEEGVDVVKQGVGAIFNHFRKKHNKKQQMQDPGVAGNGDQSGQPSTQVTRREYVELLELLARVFDDDDDLFGRDYDYLLEREDDDEPFARYDFDDDLFERDDDGENFGRDDDFEEFYGRDNYFDELD